MNLNLDDQPLKGQDYTATRRTFGGVQHWNIALDTWRFLLISILEELHDAPVETAVSGELIHTQKG